MVNTARRVWGKINEPRIIAVTYCAGYLVLLLAGAYALLNPPNSVEGATGALAMNMLALLLVFGSSVGVVSVLPGIWWLERTAVLSIGLASAIYLMIIVTLHVQGTGNRLLQASFVAFVLLVQVVRWERVRQRPYDPDRVIRTGETS